MSAFSGEAIKSINFFTRENRQWCNAFKIASQKTGIIYATDKEPGELWFKTTAGKKERYQWASKPITVKDVDECIFQYKAIKGTRFTLDIFWNNAPKKMLRPVPDAPGDGQWHKVSIPVRGKSVRFVLGLHEKITNKTAIAKVFIKPLILRQKYCEPKVDHSCLKFPIIIPEPKIFKSLDAEIELVNKDNVQFGVCMNLNKHDLKQEIVNEIAEKCKVETETIKTQQNISKLKGCKTIINLSPGDNIANVPDKKEAYVITFKKEGEKNIITLAANDNAGLYWAWLTLSQMIFRKGEKTYLYAADVQDWPDLNHRALVCSNLKELKRLVAVKFNQNNYEWWMHRGAWTAGKSKRQKIVDEMLKYGLIRGVNTSLVFTPFHEKISISVSDDTQIERLFKLYEPSLKAGCKLAVLKIDDGGRRKDSFTPADKKAYGNDRLLSHAWFAKKMSDRIWKEFPDVKITVCTSKYETDEGIKDYYNKIGVSQKLIITWTGKQCVTFDYPEDVIDKYEKGIEGRRYIMFDNTPGQCFGMYRRLQLCEMYGKGYKNLSKRKNFLGARPNGIGNGLPCSVIKAFQVAEYLWNAKNYNPEKARQRAIAKVSGNPDAVAPIIRFNDEYLKIAFKYPVDKRLSGKKPRNTGVGFYKLDDNEIFRYGIDSKEYAKLKHQTSRIKKLLEKIKSSCRNPQLTAELYRFYENMNKVLDYLHKNNKPLPLFKASGTFYFNMNDVPGGIRYKDRGNGKISCVIYGRQTPDNMLEATFQMETLPQKNAILVVEGRNCDKNIADIIVKLNNRKLYDGKSPFIQNGWKLKEFHVPAEYFKKGRNTIKIINTCQSSDYIDHWAIISEIGLRF